MRFESLTKLLNQASADGYAVPAFCVWNAETIRTVLDIASQLRAPVILMNGPGEFSLLGPMETCRIAYSLIDQYDVLAVLHLDHGKSLKEVNACLQAGYTSVMLDYSTRPFNENVRILKRVVSLAHPMGVSVEGELGHVGKVDKITKEGKNKSSLTNPEEAVSFVRQTGIDALAVSIGNAHGIYTKLPCLNFKLLDHLHKVIPIPLVLHGGSGTSEEDLQHAISSGIAKVNIASELILAVRMALMNQWNKGKNLWVPTAQAVAMKALAKVVRKWIMRTNAANKA